MEGWLGRQTAYLLIPFLQLLGIPMLIAALVLGWRRLAWWKFALVPALVTLGGAIFWISTGAAGMGAGSLPEYLAMWLWLNAKAAYLVYFLARAVRAAFRKPEDPAASP